LEILKVVTAIADSRHGGAAFPLLPLSPLVLDSPAPLLLIRAATVPLLVLISKAIPFKANFQIPYPTRPTFLI
jgi:hypothetical protein